MLTYFCFGVSLIFSSLLSRCFFLCLHYLKYSLFMNGCRCSNTISVYLLLFHISSHFASLSTLHALQIWFFVSFTSSQEWKTKKKNIWREKKILYNILITKTELFPYRTIVLQFQYVLCKYFQLHCLIKIKRCSLVVAHSFIVHVFGCCYSIHSSDPSMVNFIHENMVMRRVRGALLVLLSVLLCYYCHRSTGRPDFCIRDDNSARTLYALRFPCNIAHAY